MTAVTITGYASLDYAFRLDRPPASSTRPRPFSRDPNSGRGFLGGSPAYVATAMVSAGSRDVTPVSWIGDDADGRRYSAALMERGVSVEGLALRSGRTPVCVLAYQPDGGCHWLLSSGAGGAV